MTREAQRGDAGTVAAAPQPTEPVNTLAVTVASRHWFGLDPWLLAIVALFLAFRLAALLSYRPGGYVVDWTERYFFGFWLRYVDAGYFPYTDFWMEYPPLLPWFGILAHWAAQAMPIWRDPAFWFSLTTGLPLLLFDLGSLALVFAITDRIAGRVSAALAAAAFASLLVPLYYWLSGFDGPAVFAILAVVWLALPRERRLFWRAALAGLVLGLGMQYKLVPVAIAPAALWAFWFAGRRGAAGVFFAVTAATNIAVSLPFFLANPAMVTASYASIFTRSSWETVYALLDGYFGGGLVAPVDQRFDPAIAYQAQHSAAAPWIIVTVAAGLLILAAVSRRHDWRSPRTVTALVFFSLLVFLLSSKGWSAQFAVYPLPFMLILWPNVRGAVYAALLSLVNMLEWPFWLAMFGENAAILTFLVLFRTALLAALAVECWLLVRPRFAVPVMARRLAAGAAIAVLALGIGWMAAVYAGNAYQNDPYQALMQQLQADGAPVLFTDDVLYREVRPFAGIRLPLLLVEPGSPVLAEQVGPYLNASHLSLVFAGTDADRGPNRVIEGWLAARMFPAGEQWLANARIARFTGGSLGVAQPADAIFGGAIALPSYALDHGARAGEPIRLLLQWKSVAPAADLKVFVHAVDATGTLAAQQDGVPVAGTRPTSGWQPGDIIDDRRTIVIDTPGEYRLLVGLYDAAGKRLTLADGSDALNLGTVTVRP